MPQSDYQLIQFDTSIAWHVVLAQSFYWLIQVFGLNNGKHKLVEGDLLWLLPSSL